MGIHPVFCGECDGQAFVLKVWRMITWSDDESSHPKSERRFGSHESMLRAQ